VSDPSSGGVLRGDPRGFEEVGAIGGLFGVYIVKYPEEPTDNLVPAAVSELLEAFRTRARVDLIRESVPLVMQQLIEAEASEKIGAAGSEPHPGRGFRVDDPQLRKGSYLPVILEPRRRIDQASYAVVMEAYVAGSPAAAVGDPGRGARDRRPPPSPRFRGSAPVWTRS
jgi:putative transposase